MSKGKIVKIRVKTGTRAPDASMSQKLGSNQVNVKMFLDKFNDATKKMKPDILMSVHITVIDKQKFDICVKGPVIATRIKEILKIEKGSSRPNMDFIATINQDQIQQIAEEKISFSNAYDIEQVSHIIAGTAKSMGIKVNA